MVFVDYSEVMGFEQDSLYTSSQINKIRKNQLSKIMATGVPGND
jgi:hypothetical protein